ncbi:hypothetical protein V1477_008222, partial [Vespula maculifrons]
IIYECYQQEYKGFFRDERVYRQVRVNKLPHPIILCQAQEANRFLSSNENDLTFSYRRRVYIFQLTGRRSFANNGLFNQMINNRYSKLDSLT